MLGTRRVLMVPGTGVKEKQKPINRTSNVAGKSVESQQQQASIAGKSVENPIP